MIGRRALRWLPLAGTAASGVMAGHWFAYAVAIPGAGLRAQVLAETGHSYWELAIKLVAVLAVVGLGAVVSDHLGGDPAGERSRGYRLALTTRRLIVLQVLGFLAMETVERVAAGSPLGGMLAHHLLFIGLAVQVVTAAVAGVLITWLSRGVALVVATICRRMPSGRVSRSRFPRRPVVGRRWLVPAGATGPRGPPR